MAPVHPRHAGPLAAGTSELVDPRPLAEGDADRAVLLLHGLTGTPHEVRPMAQALLGAGYAVRAPLLAGHTDVEALERSTWRDWYASAQGAFDELRDGGRRSVVVLGFSMGALLCLRLAALKSSQVHGAIAIAVPLSVPRWQRRAVRTLARMRETRMLRNMVGVFSKRGGPDIRVRRQVDDSPSLGAVPYPTLAEFVALQEEVEDLLPHVRPPLLLLHGALDHTADPSHSERVAQLVASERVERRILPRSFHVVGLDLDRDHACGEIVRFVDSLFASPRGSST